jgi:integrase
MGEAWIEKHKRPGQGWAYKLRWRDPGSARKAASPLYYNREEVDAAKQAKDAELQQAWSLRRASRGPLLPLSAIIERWAAARLAEGAVRATYAAEVAAHWTAILALTKWKTTNEITPEALAAWRQAKRGRGVDKPLIALRSVLGWARDHLRQPVDPSVLSAPLTRRAAKVQPRLLTDDQVRSIIRRAAEFGEPAALLVEMLATYGMRPIELCRLDVRDWDGTQLTRHDTKNRSSPRHAVLPAHARRLDRLVAQRPPDAPLFLSPKGARWRIDATGTARELVDWYWSNVSVKLTEVGVEQRGIYCLKDFAITSMRRRGIDRATISAFTGIKTMRVYDHYEATNPENVAAALAQISAPVPTAPKGADSGALCPQGGKTGGARGRANLPKKTEAPVKSA